MHFSLKNLTSVCNKFKDFPENQMTNFMQNFQILSRIWKHVNNAKHWIAIASKTVTAWTIWIYYRLQFYSRWMISPVSSVSFLVYTCFLWSREAITVGGVVAKPEATRGCKNITVCNANSNLPESAKFQNSTFSPSKCCPLLSAAPGGGSPSWALTTMNSWSIKTSHNSTSQKVSKRSRSRFRSRLGEKI